MMTSFEYEPEMLWENLLSTQSDRILSAYKHLSTEEQASVVNHLNRMVTEPGWLPVQRDSARVALDVLAHLHTEIPGGSE